MAAPVVRVVSEPRPSFEAGAPVALFEAHMTHSPFENAIQYDVTADGKRFLINTGAPGSGSAPPLTVVLNWNAGVTK